MQYVKRVLSILAIALMALIALFAAGVLWPQKHFEPMRTRTPFAITNVAVVDVVTGTVARGRTVIVDQGRIRSVGSNPLQPGTRVIDGGGKYLVPAFWDMHTHVLAVSPMLDLPLYIAYGVTNVRDMQGCPQTDDPFVACPEDKRRWTAEAVAGARVGPRIVASTSWMAEGPGIVRRLGDVPAYFDTATPAQARQFVRHFAGKVDAIKVYASMLSATGRTR